MTQGQILFYGGIAGLVIMTCVSGILWAVTRKSRARLKKILDAEYETLPDSAD